jgi:hypothetical protein
MGRYGQMCEAGVVMLSYIALKPPKDIEFFWVESFNIKCIVTPTAGEFYA